MLMGARQVYLICKRMADDPTQIEHRRNVERQRAAGLGWRFDGLGDWPTDAIFARLRELGIDTDAERFADQARRARRCRALEDLWLAGPSYREVDYSQDFAFIASEELWERLTPELLCPEIVSNRLEAAIDRDRKVKPATAAAATAGGVPADLAAALSLANYVAGFPRANRAARFAEVRDSGVEDYLWWASRIILTHGPQYPDEITRLADILSDCVDDRTIPSDLAMILAIAGRGEQAEARVRAHLAAYPDDPWVNIEAGDVYEELGDDHAAVDLWVRALSVATRPVDWDAAAERTQDVLKHGARPSEWDEIRRAHPRPMEPRREVEPHPPAPAVPPDSSPIHTRFADPPMRQPAKVGRNDPCPCGSGKKFKKCCRP